MTEEQQPTAPRRRRPSSRAVATWALSAAMIGASWVLLGNVPDEARERDAFAADISAQGWAANDSIRLRIDDVHTADRVFQDAWVADGRWVTVDLTGEALETEIGARIGYAGLTVGGLTFQTTESSPRNAYQGGFFAGIPSHTTLAFQIPEDLELGDARLVVWPSTVYPELGSEIAFDLDLAKAAHRATVKLKTTSWEAK